MSNNLDLDDLIKVLKKKNSKQEIVESKKYINNLLYFLRDDKVLLFYKEIEKSFKTNEKSIEYENIITNIIQLFPLTEKIVKKIMYHMKRNEKRYIVQSYDINRILIDGLKYFLSNFDIIENEEIEIIKEYNLQIKKYRSKKEKLESEKKELESKIIENKILFNENRNLEEEVKKLKIRIAEEKTEIENKRKKLKVEKEITENGQRMKDKIHEEINDIDKNIAEKFLKEGYFEIVQILKELETTSNEEIVKYEKKVSNYKDELNKKYQNFLKMKSECEIKIQNLKHKINVKIFLPSSHNVSINVSINEIKSKKISLMEYLEELQDVQKSYKSYEYKVKIEDGIKELEKALKNEDFDYILKNTEVNEIINEAISYVKNHKKGPFHFLY